MKTKRHEVARQGGAEVARQGGADQHNSSNYIIHAPHRPLIAHTGVGKKVGPYRVPVVMLENKLKKAWGV